MGDAELVRKHMEFLPVEGSNLIAFMLKDHANGDEWKDIVVAFNSRPETAMVIIPPGEYTIVCKDGTINLNGLGKVKGKEVSVPARSALIMYRK